MLTIAVLALLLACRTAGFEASLKRNLQVTTQNIGGYTYTCDMTTKAFSFGGT